MIVFGVDEDVGYLEQGVYDAQDLQKKINEQCLQMEPVVRPLLTVVEKDGKNFVAAEIPGMDIDAGILCMTQPEKPRSSKQRYYSVQNDQRHY